MWRDILWSGHNTWPWLNLRLTCCQYGNGVFSPFYPNAREHPIIPSTFLQRQGTSLVVAAQETIDRMLAALENANPNLTIV